MTNKLNEWIGKKVFVEVGDEEEEVWVCVKVAGVLHKYAIDAAYFVKMDENDAEQYISFHVGRVVQVTSQGTIRLE